MFFIINYGMINREAQYNKINKLPSSFGDLAKIKVLYVLYFFIYL